MKIEIKKLHPDALLPVRATENDAGYDLFSNESILLNPFERRLVKTGISIAIPNGYYGRIAPRSGLALKKGIDVMAGVIDSGYRGEVGVILINFEGIDFFSKMSRGEDVSYYTLFGLPGCFRINKGDKIAQIIIEKCHDIEWDLVDGLSKSQRGEKGFGHSG